MRESAKRPQQGGPILATRPHLAQARAPTHPKRPQSGLDARGFLQPGQLRANPVPHFLPQRL
jgi:hypothetical protein